MLVPSQFSHQGAPKYILKNLVRNVLISVSCRKPTTSIDSQSQSHFQLWSDPNCSLYQGLYLLVALSHHKDLSWHARNSCSALWHTLYFWSLWKKTNPSGLQWLFCLFDCLCAWIPHVIPLLIHLPDLLLALTSAAAESLPFPWTPALLLTLLFSSLLLFIQDSEPFFLSIFIPPGIWKSCLTYTNCNTSQNTIFSTVFKAFK